MGKALRGGAELLGQSMMVTGCQDGFYISSSNFVALSFGFDRP